MNRHESYERLLAQRIVFLSGPLDAARANEAIARMLHLQAADATAEITLYINCAEADAHASLAVYDTMQTVSPDLRTVCVGQAGGGAVLVLAAGRHGKRSASPHARIRLSMPRGELRGRAGEIDVAARELLRLRQQMHGILSRCTGQPLEKIERDSERELSLSAEEAREYGLIDAIARGRAD